MNSVNTAKHVNLWQSPIPYLFGSLALVLVIITVSLVLLLCSYLKRSNSIPSENDHDPEKPPAVLLKVLDPEPKFVVIMAGDDEPTYLANPVGAFSTPVCRCEQL